MLDWSIIIIVNVKNKVDTPIKPCMYIEGKANEVKLIDFRYEKLHMFHFQCGLMGNKEDHCKTLVNLGRGIT